MKYPAAMIVFVLAAFVASRAIGEERWLLPDATRTAVVWRYSLEKPADGWTVADFDDAAWKEGKAGFGSEGTPGGVIGTPWETHDIWLRTVFAYRKYQWQGYDVLLRLAWPMHKGAARFLRRQGREPRIGYAGDNNGPRPASRSRSQTTRDAQHTERLRGNACSAGHAGSCLSDSRWVERSVEQEDQIRYADTES